MKCLWILDELVSLKADKDTSLALMREASSRGHQLWVAGGHDFILNNATLQVWAQAATPQGPAWQLDSKTLHLPQHFDVILLRKNPPFDNEYLYLTMLLEIAEQQGTRVLNRPSAVRSWNEKLAVSRFVTLAPSFLVTAQIDEILCFLTAMGDIVVKPMDGMGGSGVFKISLGDVNTHAILEMATQMGTKIVMAQRYLPAIRAGDKRIVMVNGQPLPFALARVPRAGELRGNLAVGGQGIAQPLSERDSEIAQSVGKVIKEEGLFLVGLDVIGDSLTEINVTSPTGIVEIAAQTNYKPAKAILRALENYLL